MNNKKEGFGKAIGLDVLLKALIRHFSIFIYGYSNLMYVNGVSSKTHRYFVYGSYIVIILFISSMLFVPHPEWNSYTFYSPFLSMIKYLPIILIVGAYWLYKRQHLLKSIIETIKINPTIRRYIMKVLSLLLFRRFR